MLESEFITHGFHRGSFGKKPSTFLAVRLFLFLAGFILESSKLPFTKTQAINRIHDDV